MGRGNIHTRHPYESTTYVDYDYFNTYSHKYLVDEYGDPITTNDKLMNQVDSNTENWNYDDLSSELYYNDFIDELKALLLKKFPSLYHASHCLLENKLFAIHVEDNEWSVAIMLYTKESYDYDTTGFQKRHYQNYTHGIRQAILKLVPTFSLATSAWTSQTVTAQQFQQGAI